MFDQEIEGLDASEACAALAAAHRELLAVECRQLVLAAHWIDLHASADEPHAVGSPDTGPARATSRRAGTERLVRVGADGTPWIGEFACAEFAAVQDLHPAAGRALLAKVANLRHRHPRLWRRVLAGQVRGWKALEVARIVGREDYALTLPQARWVDAQTASWIDSLPWGSFLSLLEARIIAADPQAADLRARQAAARRYVSSGRVSEHGLRTFIAQAAAGDVVRLIALCDRIAQILSEQGDADPVDARRATALGSSPTPPAPSRCSWPLPKPTPANRMTRPTFLPIPNWKRSRIRSRRGTFSLPTTTATTPRTEVPTAPATCSARTRPGS
jgi:hypothetical protein